MSFLLSFLIAQFVMARPTQKLWIPETEVLGKDQYRLDLQQQATPDKRAGDTGTQYRSSFGLEAGVMQFDDVDLEAGLDWVEPAYQGIEEALQLNFKARMFDVNEHGWSVAMGANSVGFKYKVNDWDVIFANLENRFGQSWRVGIGGYVGSAALLVNDMGLPDEKGVFLGLWRDVQRKRGAITLQHQTGRSALGYTFLGLQLELRENVPITVGYGFSNNRVSQRDWLLARLSVGF